MAGRSMTKIGHGEITSGKGCTGVLRSVQSIQDVLELMQKDLSETIVFTTSASATTLTPIFPKIKGIICTAGGPTSHLAIVAREFGLPCVMGSEIHYDGQLDGQRVSFNDEGEIFLASHE